MQTQKRIHYIQHVPYESPGSIIDWAKLHDVQLTSTRIFDGGTFDRVAGFDLLVVMGGPMGVHDEDRFPWLKKEKAFIEDAIKENRGVLGICLGAQLVADVLGSRVTGNKYKEIGWFPIRVTAENRANPVTGCIPDGLMVFHWHGDTFDLPAGATRIATSEACINQGFIYRGRVVGLQFHLEVTSESLREMTTNGRSELAKEQFVQDESTILAGVKFAGLSNSNMDRILTNLLTVS